MIGGIIATTIRVAPIVTLLAALGILVGMISLAVYGAVVSRREAKKAVTLASSDVKQTS